jgi:hypothetical protein
MGQGRDAVTKNSDAPKVKGAPHPDFPNVTGLLPEPKRLWLEALRSGRFQQGHTMLAVDRGDGMQFCCLGVLCEVAIEAGLDLPRTERAPAFGVEKRSLAYGGCTVMPPEEVWEWAYGTGVGVGSVVITEQDEENQCERLVDKELAYLNDDEGWTFEQIANAIEESL